MVEDRPSAAENYLDGVFGFTVGIGSSGRRRAKWPAQPLRSRLEFRPAVRIELPVDKLSAGKLIHTCNSVVRAPFVNRKTVDIVGG